MRSILTPGHRHHDDGPPIHLHVFDGGVESRIGVVGDGLDYSLSGLGADLHTQDRAVISHAKQHVTAVRVSHSRCRPHARLQFGQRALQLQLLPFTLADESSNFLWGQITAPLASVEHANVSPRLNRPTVQVDVLPPGQFGVETSAHLQQRAHPAIDLGPPLRRLGDAGEDLEQRSLPRPVAADDAHDLAALHLEGHILQGPDGLVGDSGRLTTHDGG